MHILSSKGLGQEVRGENLTVGDELVQGAVTEFFEEGNPVHCLPDLAELLVEELVQPILVLCGGQRQKILLMEFAQPNLLRVDSCGPAQNGVMSQCH